MAVKSSSTKNVQKYGSKNWKISFQLCPQLKECDTFLAAPVWNASDRIYIVKRVQFSFNTGILESIDSIFIVKWAAT